MSSFNLVPPFGCETLKGMDSFIRRNNPWYSISYLAHTSCQIYLILVWIGLILELFFSQTFCLLEEYFLLSAFGVYNFGIFFCAQRATPLCYIQWKMTFISIIIITLNKCLSCAKHFTHNFICWFAITLQSRHSYTHFSDELESWSSEKLRNVTQLMNGQARIQTQIYDF